VRRVITIVLAGTGAFFVVLAVLAKFYVVGQAVKFPLNEYLSTTLEDPNASYFSRAQLTDLNVPVTVTDTIKGDAKAGNSATAVWNEFQVLKDDFNNVNFNYLQRRAPFDRRTGELVNCCGAFLEQSNSPRLSGQGLHLSGQGFVWPFGAQQRTYMVFDTTLAKAMPASYAGTATADGVRTYSYVERVAPQQFTTLTLPGSLVGMQNQREVTLPEYYQAVNTYWVNPVTGTPLDLEQNETLTLRDSTGATRLLVFRADLKMNSSSIAKLVSTDRGNANKINLVGTVLPLALLVVGVVLFGVAIIPLAFGRRGEHHALRNGQPVSTAPSGTDMSR
jgi:Porin PorA